MPLRKWFSSPGATNTLILSLAETSAHSKSARILWLSEDHRGGGVLLDVRAFFLSSSSAKPIN